MGTTQPIREKNDLKQFLDYYKTVQPNPRNYALAVRHWILIPAFAGSNPASPAK